MLRKVPHNVVKAKTISWRTDNKENKQTDKQTEQNSECVFGYDNDLSKHRTTKSGSSPASRATQRSMPQTTTQPHCQCCMQQVVDTRCLKSNTANWMWLKIITTKLTNSNNFSDNNCSYIPGQFNVDIYWKSTKMFKLIKGII